MTSHVDWNPSEKAVSDWKMWGSATFWSVLPGRAAHPSCFTDTHLFDTHKILFLCVTVLINLPGHSHSPND